MAHFIHISGNKIEIKKDVYSGKWFAVIHREHECGVSTWNLFSGVKTKKSVVELVNREFSE